MPHRLRQTTPAETTILREQVRQWLAKGVIEPRPLNAYANNLVYVAKKSGAIRVCVDCTPVNDVTEDYAWPLPNLHDLRHRLPGTRWFARMDMRDAFFRILVPQSFRLYTSFRCDGKQYQFRRMPFGLKTAPSTFQRFMETHLAPYLSYAFCFIDDILVTAETRQQLRQRVTRIRKKLRTIGVEINEEKSELEATELLFVGLWITRTTVGPDQAKVAELMQIPAPTTKKDAQSALGLVSYLRGFTPLVSHYTSQLYPDRDGLRLPAPQYCQEWARLKRHLASAMTSLRHYDPKEPAHLFADASNRALGVILIQRGAVVSLASRNLTPAETRYSATDREHLALVFAASKFKMMLHQSGCDTKIYSDHAALIGRRDDDLLPRQARWRAKVNHWMPNVQHVKGIWNPADFVSRWGLEISGGVLKT